VDSFLARLSRAQQAGFSSELLFNVARNCGQKIPAIINKDGMGSIDFTPGLVLPSGWEYRNLQISPFQ
jgi:hypothetical protein